MNPQLSVTVPEPVPLSVTVSVGSLPAMSKESTTESAGVENEHGLPFRHEIDALLALDHTWW